VNWARRSPPKSAARSKARSTDLKQASQGDDLNRIKKPLMTSEYVLCLESADVCPGPETARSGARGRQFRPANTPSAGTDGDVIDAKSATLMRSTIKRATDPKRVGRSFYSRWNLFIPSQTRTIVLIFVFMHSSLSTNPTCFIIPHPYSFSFVSQERILCTLWQVASLLFDIFFLLHSFREKIVKIDINSCFYPSSFTHSFPQ